MYSRNEKKFISALTYVRSVNVSIFDGGTIAFNFDLFAHGYFIVVVCHIPAQNALHIHLRVFLKPIVAGYLNSSDLVYFIM